MNNKTKKRKVVTVAIVTFSVIIIGMAADIVIDVLKENVSYSARALDEYNKLFNDYANTKLHIISTVQSKSQYPTSIYIYDSLFNVSVMKVALVKEIPLEKLLLFQPKSFQQSPFETYSSFKANSRFSAKIMLGKIPQVSRISFGVTGDSLKFAIKKESEYCIFFNFIDFSISFNDGSTAIYASSNDGFVPASIAFIEKKDFLYIVCLTSVEYNGKIVPNNLSSILK